MIDIDNTTNLTIDAELLEKITLTLTNQDIELVITNSTEIQEINNAHRGIDTPTDVLSFPYEEMPNAPLGSIVINAEYVIQKAQELGHSEEQECTLLYIHGLLHILGFDHEVDNGEMRQKEQEIIEKFSLPQSLIVRTQG